MKKRLWIAAAALMVVLAMVSACADESSFTFRGGVRFGMSIEELKQAESESGQIAEGEWQTTEIGKWFAMGTNKRVTVSKDEAHLLYMSINGQMQAAIYDFYEDPEKPSDARFQDMRTALSAVYGVCEAVSAADMVTLMDCFLPDFYHEEDIREAAVWQKEDVDVYQFFYRGGAFVIMYTNPHYDYASVNAEVDVTGL